ncbi:MAG: enoyl-CoA hydratase/carnithine racemase [Glaciecola sp.]|jgi:enoyl-CoA hydratase/carnithine racemase
MGEFVRLEVDREKRVGTVRLERPPMNALSQQVCLELQDAVAQAEADDNVQALVVWGGPKVFAAGADIKEFPNWTYADVKGQAGSILQRTMDRLARLPMATIAAVNGYALGGGCELALACDFRYIADSAKMGLPEITLGIMPGAGGTQRLPRLIGVSRAKQLIFSGRPVDAVEAERIGLANKVCPTDDVYDEAVVLAGRLANAPYALRLAKQAIDEGVEGTLDQGLRLEQHLFAEAFTTKDARTGIASFVENGPGKATFAQE